MSPSTQREWIEIASSGTYGNTSSSLPLHRGSGLKWKQHFMRCRNDGSPSTQREWIEMTTKVSSIRDMLVSLYTEGVD